jgi:hypothetical protein
VLFIKKPGRFCLAILLSLLLVAMGATGLAQNVTDIPGAPIPASPFDVSLVSWDDISVYSIDLHAGQTISLLIVSTSGDNVAMLFYPPGTTSVNDGEYISWATPFDPWNFTVPDSGTYYMCFVTDSWGNASVTYSVTTPDNGSGGQDPGGGYQSTGTIGFAVQPVQPSLSITAHNLSLGTLAAGSTHTSTRNPVTVSADVAWDVTAIAEDDFYDGEETTISIGNLEMNNFAMQKTGGAAIVIAGSNEAAAGYSPDVFTEITIPSGSEYAGKAFSTTIIYTIVPQ